jgi:hypothetical protein
LFIVGSFRQGIFDDIPRRDRNRKHLRQLPSLE